MFTVLCTVACIACASTSHAADSSWNVDAGGNWNTSGNWTAGIPGSTSILTSTDIATFSNTLTGARAVTVDSNRNIGGITFGNTSNFGFTLSGGSLRLTNGGLIQTLATGNHTDTIQTPISLQGDATFGAGAAALGKLTISGAVTGTGNIVLDNDGGVVSGLILNGSINNTGTITNSGSGFGRVSISGVIGANVTGVTQNSASALLLSGANVYTGSTILSAGVVQVNVASAGSVGAITSSALGKGTLVFNGGALSATDSITARTILNTVSFTGDGEIGDLVNSAALTFSAPIDLGAATRTLAVNSAATISGVISNGGLAKAGAGLLTLNGSAVNTFSGGVEVRAGGLALNFANLATPTDLLDSANTLGIAGGGALSITGKATGSTSQTLGNLTVGTAGGSLLVNPNGGTGTTLTLGSLNATTAGGSLLIGRALGAGTGTLSITTTSDKDAQGIYGGRIVFANGTANTGFDWATTASGSAPYTLSAFAGYSALTLTSGTDTSNSRITAGQALTGSRTTNTLKIENPAAGNLTLALGANTLTLTSGGLLVTGTGGTAISGTAGATRLTAGNGSGSYDLIVHQFNSGGLTISAPIGDNGSNPVTLVKAGTGNLTLTGANTHSGGTLASAGTLTLGSTTALGTGRLTIENGAILSSPGNVTNANNNAITINGNFSTTQGSNYHLGLGAISLGTAAGTARQIAVVGSFTSEGSTWTLGGNITDGTTANSLIKLGNGGLRLTGVNTYTGTTSIRAGTVAIATVQALPGWDVNGRWNAVNGGSLAVGNAVTDAEIATLLATTNFSHGSQLSFDTSAGHRTYAGNITNTSQGILGLQAFGLGSITLTGNNTFTGSIQISAELVIGSANALAGGSSINNLSALSVTNALGSVTLNNPFTLNNGVVNFGSSANSGTLVLNGTLTPNATDRGIAVAANTTVEITGRIIDSSNAGQQTRIIKSGPGVLVYNTSANTYEGGTTISGGTLLLKGANTLPTLGTLQVNVGGNFSLADGTARATSVPLLNLTTGANLSFDWNAGAVDTLTSTAAAVTAGNVGIILNPANTPTGSGLTLLSSGSGLDTANYFLANNTNFTATLAKSATDVTVSGYTAVTAPTTFYWQGNKVLGTATAGADNALAFSNGTASNWSTTQGSYTATAVVPGAAANLIFSATGAAQQNTVLGADLTVNSVTFNDSTAVTLGGSHTLTLLSTGTGASSALVVNSTANTNTTISTTNGVVLGADQTWTVASGKTLTVSASVQGGHSLIKDGDGTLNFTGTLNTYAGTTTVNAGTLALGKTDNTNSIVGDLIIGNGTGSDIVQLNSNNQIRDFSIVSFNGTGADAGIFRLNNRSETVGGLSSTGGAGIVENGNASAGTSTVTAGVLSGTQTFSGILRNNSGAGSGILALAKSGAGTQVLTGANTYTGATTVNAGTLLVNGSISGSTTTVNNTGTLGGTGTVGAVNVNAGGTLAPGASIESLATGTLTLAAGATFALEIDTTALTSDLAAIAGNLDLALTDDVVLTISDLNAQAITSGSFTFITYTGTWNGGLFQFGGNAIADDATFTAGLNQFRLDYDFGGNSVVLTAVPEPNAAVSLLGGLGLLAGLQRRRQRRSAFTL